MRHDLTTPTIHAAFEWQAHRKASAEAVRYRGLTLTYGEVNALANRIARRLRNLGVERESLVGVSIERCAELVPVLLGVLKAGASYVPLDPSYPLERLQAMLASSGAKVLITQSSFRGRFPDSGCVKLCIDEEVDALSKLSTDDLGLPGHPHNALYCIFTSGSTGKPKGVIGTHGATMNRIAWMDATFPLRKTKRVAQRTALSFVDSVCEIFGPLTTGGCVVVMSAEAIQNPEQLLDELEQAEVERMSTVPSLMSAMFASAQSALKRFSCLDMLILSGESTSRTLADRLSALNLPTRMLNLYGPTETAADSLAFEFDRLRLPAQCASVPIGKPIWNTDVHVLDALLEPVGPMQIGEIYLGGMGLARGYLDRGDLTAERFVPDPFSRQTGQRLYRTGDLGRWLDNGQLECLGRIDHQVKVRGHRIELGEVEGSLREHSRVQDAAVVARSYGEGDHRLVAYVVVNREQDNDDLGALRVWLRQRLPGFMVPQVWVALEAMPLMPNGKLDRARLPESVPPVGRGDAPEREHLREGALVRIWEDLLHVQGVGVHENFFELGGDSILAMRMVALAKEQGIEVALCDVFERKTIGALLSEPSTLSCVAPTSVESPVAASRTRTPPSEALLRNLLSEIGE